MRTTIIHSAKFLNRLYYHNLNIRICPTQTIHLEHWIGSVLRNNFLYAAEQVKADKETTLLTLIDRLPLSESHPLYREVAGGFPKGYSLDVTFPDNSKGNTAILHEGEIFTFSFCLIGRMSHYFSFFIEAVRKMCERGIGTSMVPLQLIDVCEVHPGKKTRLLSTMDKEVSTSLKYPVYITDFLDEHCKEGLKNGIIDIHFETPTCLVKSQNKVNSDASFQDKQNGFPSFYQLTRTVAYRLLKLSMLYIPDEEQSFSDNLYEELDKWLLRATHPILISSNIRYVNLKNTPKKEPGNHVIKLGGYMGQMRYSYAHLDDVLPVLLFARNLGAGHNTVYGLGKYTVKCSNK